MGDPYELWLEVQLWWQGVYQEAAEAAGDMADVITAAIAAVGDAIAYGDKLRHAVAAAWDPQATIVLGMHAAAADIVEAPDRSAGAKVWTGASYEAAHALERGITHALEDTGGGGETVRFEALHQELKQLADDLEWTVFDFLSNSLGVTGIGLAIAEVISSVFGFVVGIVGTAIGFVSKAITAVSSLAGALNETWGMSSPVPDYGW